MLPVDAPSAKAVAIEWERNARIEKQNQKLYLRMREIETSSKNQYNENEEHARNGYYLINSKISHARQNIKKIEQENI